MEEYPVILNRLKEEFIARYNRSRERETLLQREIELYSLVFDAEKLPLPGVVFFDEEIVIRDVILRTTLKISTDDLRQIRYAYSIHIVDGREMPKLDDLKSDLLKKEDIKEKENYEKLVYYANQAVAYFEYLRWLKQYTPDEEKSKRKFPEKYYAWYHKILIAITKADKFLPGDKKSIEAVGRSLYNCKSGFYQAFIDFKIDKPETFVNSLTPKDRGKWKKIIEEISSHNIEVINYLKNFPN